MLQILQRPSHTLHHLNVVSFSGNTASFPSISNCSVIRDYQDLTLDAESSAIFDPAHLYLYFLTPFSESHPICTVLGLKTLPIHIPHTPTIPIHASLSLFATQSGICAVSLVCLPRKSSEFTLPGS